MENFDPYHKWLGVPKNEQPPNHYRLLGIALFEAELDVIEAAADRQMAYVKQCATGPHLALSQKLLNELAAARVTLLVPAKKQAYDAQLRLHLDEEHLIERSMQPVILKGASGQSEPANHLKIAPEPQPRVHAAKSGPPKSGNPPQAVGLELPPLSPQELVLNVRRQVPQQRRLKSKRLSKLPWIIVALVVVSLFVWLLVPPASKRNAESIAASPTNSAAVSNSQPVASHEIVRNDRQTEPEPSPVVAMPPSSLAPERKPPTKPKPAEIADRHGPFALIEAKYGVEGQWIDLTQRVQAADPGLIGVIVGNSLVGRDPKFGVHKQFVVRYQSMGRLLSQCFRDQASIAVIDGRTPPEMDPNGSLIIHEGKSGRGIAGEGTWVDVTDRLRNQIMSDAVVCSVDDVVGNTNPNDARAIIVRWSCQGLWWTSAFDASDTVRLGTQAIAIQKKNSAEAATDANAGLVIYEATYGARGSFVDWTDRAQTAARSGRLIVVPNNLLVREDPVPNATKQLRVRYRLFGQPFDQLFGENSFVMIDGRQPTNEELGNELRILSAYCGHGFFGEGKMVDVTDQLQTFVRDNSLQITANSIMDQASGSIRPRWLTVRYAYQGEAHTATFDEGDTIRLGR